MPIDFEFSPGTVFDAHKAPEPEPPPEPDPSAPAKPARKRKVPVGQYPLARPKRRIGQKGHAWALHGDWKPIYVEALSRYGTHTDAADAADVTAETARKHRKLDPQFDADCENARARFTDGLIRECLHRAIVGKEQKVYDKRTGEVVSLGNVPDNIMLMFVTKAFAPWFRENYRAEEQQNAAVAVGQMFVSFLSRFDARSNDQSIAPSFDDFLKEQAVLPPPSAPPTPPADADAADADD